MRAYWNRPRRGRWVALTAVAVAGALWAGTAHADVTGPAQPAQESGAGAAIPVATKLRFAWARIDGLHAHVSPRVDHRNTAFVMPILHPMRVVAAECVRSDGSHVLPAQVDVEGNPEDRCPDSAEFALWYQLEGATGKVGWAPADHVAIWNSRHALRPSTDGSEDELPGYCDVTAVANASMGRSEPCVMFNRRVLAAHGERAPFPVLDVREFGDGIEYDRRQYFRVLVPTLYGNLAPQAARTKKAPPSQTVAHVTEFFILVDTSPLAQASVEGTRDALKRVVRELETDPRLNARFVVIGYRSSRGAPVDCSPQVATTDEHGRLGFVSGSDAVRFLDQRVERGACGPDVSFWDAMYLLRDLDPIPGASRALLLIGDAPATAMTQGLTSGNLTVPQGISSRAVLSDLHNTMGESSALFAVFNSSRRARQTAEQILQKARFYNFSLDRIRKPTAAMVEGRVVSHLSSHIVRSVDDLVDVDDCRLKMRHNEAGRAYGFFCGADGELPNPLRDLVRQQGREDANTVVLRDLWIPSSPVLQSVALLTVAEGRQMGQTLKSLAQRIGEDGTGCGKLGPTSWVEAIRDLVPVEQAPRPSSDPWDRPPIVGKRLHDYWGLFISKGDSLIVYSPEQIVKLADDRCFALSNRLHRASRAIERTLNLVKQDPYLWLSFVNIP